MKFTSCGPTLSAAMIRSPSFSRSSSSMITAILPWRRSSRISSIVLNVGMGALLFGFGHEPLEVAGDHVDFNVDAVAGLQFAERGHFVRVWNDVDVEAPAFDLVHGQAHAVDGNRTLRRDEAHQWRRQFELQA